MELTPDGPLALPLWINGHAYLTMAASFFDVTNPQTGQVLRRVPLCDAVEASRAVAAAQGAEAAWAALGVAGRQEMLHRLAAALEGYAAHFARLIAQDTGWPPAAAEAEVAAAVAAWRDCGVGMTGVVGLVSDASAPLAAFSRLAAPALLAGATLVAKPSPKAPSAIFALAELSGRAGWPAGVFNVLHGDTAAVAGLCAAPIDRLAFAGGEELLSAVRAMAQEHGKIFVAGT